MKLRHARTFSVSLVLAAAGLGLWPMIASSQDDGPGTETLSLANDASRRAAKKALDWLVANQEESGA